MATKTTTPPITPKKSATSALLLTEEKKRIDEIARKEEAEVKQIQEGLSWVGKLFFAGLAATLAGTVANAANVKLPFKLRGTPEQIRAIADAVIATKEFQTEIKRPGATVESVIQKLNLKNITKERFESLTGHKWPL